MLLVFTKYSTKRSCPRDRQSVGMLPSALIFKEKFPFAGPCLLVGWYLFKPLIILKKYPNDCALTSLELPIDSYCERICAVIGGYL